MFKLSVHYLIFINFRVNFFQKRQKVLRFNSNFACFSQETLLYIDVDRRRGNSDRFLWRVRANRFYFLTWVQPAPSPGVPPCPCMKTSAWSPSPYPIPLLLMPPIPLPVRVVEAQLSTPQSPIYDKHIHLLCVGASLLVCAGGA